MKRRGIPVTLLLLALACVIPASAQEADSTAPVVVDGELIELPVVRSMYRVLAIAERISARNET